MAKSPETKFDPIVLAKGDERKRFIFGKRTLITPYAGAQRKPYDRHNESATIGVGVIVPEEYNYVANPFSSPQPRRIFQTMRTLYMINDIQVGKIEPEIIIAAGIAVGKDTPPDHVAKAVEFIADETGSHKIPELRSRVMQQVPTFTLLDNMLMRLNRASIPPDSTELEAEIKEHSILRSSAIDRAIDDDRGLQEHVAKREKELQIPMEQGKGFGNFFEDIGVPNLVAGNIFGEQGKDWGIIPVSVIEMQLRRESYRSDRFYTLNTTIDNPIAASGTAGPGIEYTVLNLGAFRAPEVTTGSGTKFTFKKAKFEKGNFIVITDIESNVGSIMGQEFTVQDLRIALRERINELRKAKANSDSPSGKDRQ